MKWLLLMLWTGSGNSWVITYGIAEFSNQDKCEIAKMAFKIEQDKNSSTFNHGRVMICVEQ